MKGELHDRSEVAPSVFEKAQQQARDDELIRQNNIVVSKEYEQGINLNDKKDLTELADRLENKELAFAVGRRLLGNARFDVLLK